MKNNDKELLVEQIRYLLESEPGRTWTARQIGDILGYRGGRLKVVMAVLAELVDDGIVTPGRRHTFSAAVAQDTLEGKLELVRSGAGFVTDKEKHQTIRIAAADIGTALPGDIVRVRPVRIGRDSETGRIIKIVSRGEKLICGTLAITSAGNFVTPISQAYHRDILIEDTKGANDGDRVVVKFSSWTRNNNIPEGTIVDIIGPADKPSLDTELICREYELPKEFSNAAIDEATDAISLLNDFGERLDLRKEYILTVDPASSKDFDDALSFSINKDGTRTLGVHIADVSHFVRSGSALDKEAAERGNSIYLADKVIPMLPEQLSNGVCSLRPREDRLAVSVFITFDKNARVIKRSFTKSVIRSNLRLNYAQALAIIEDRTPENLSRVPKAAKALLQGASKLAQELRNARMRQGALNLDVPECRPTIDKDGRMTGFVVEEYDISHQMIEECMVAANEAVATELSIKGRKSIARLHESPDPTKIEDLTVNLQTLGFHPGNISTPANLSRFIASIAGHPLQAQAHTMILRSMKRACYSADDTGHFGLAKHFYSHFTSPIRRYPDLVLHRQLAETLTGEKATKFSLQYLQQVATNCTETEMRADEAERTLLEIKKYRYLQQQLDDRQVEEYDAVIAKVTSFGLFVDLPALMIGGLVHISLISDQYVRYNPHDESLYAGGCRYTLGDTLKVYVVSVDFNSRRIDFAVSQPTQPRQQQNKPKKGRKQKWTSK